MPVMDEFREERAALKNADFKTKCQYFLDYYKWHAIGGIAVLTFVISMIYSIVTAKDDALFGYFLNSFADEEYADAFITDFAETADIDLNKYQIRIDSSMQYVPGELTIDKQSVTQRIMVSLAAAEVDIMVADEETFDYFCTAETFQDLRNIYTAEELERFRDYIYYVDMDVVRKMNEKTDSETLGEYTAPVYDHFTPEEMVDPVPMGLCIQDSPKLKEAYLFASQYVPIGIVANTQRPETAKQFVEYLFEGLLE